jgi:phosphodiesterase/alkaline phosphatase D-like protein
VIVLDGLSANTKYYYRLMYRASGSGSFLGRAEHTFCTQRPAGSTFTFDITSDSHVNIVLGSAATWQQTLSNIANDNPDFLLDLGDTFAMDNVKSESVARTNYIFQRTSTTLGLISHSIPIFIVTGNHEWEDRRL